MKRGTVTCAVLGAGILAIGAGTASAAPVQSSTVGVKAAATGGVTQVRWRHATGAAVGAAVGAAAVGTAIGAAAAAPAWGYGYGYDYPGYGYAAAGGCSCPGYAYAPGYAGYASAPGWGWGSTWGGPGYASYGYGWDTPDYGWSGGYSYAPGYATTGYGYGTTGYVRTGTETEGVATGRTVRGTVRSSRSERIGTRERVGTANVRTGTEGFRNESFRTGTRSTERVVGARGMSGEAGMSTRGTSGRERMGAAGSAGASVGGSAQPATPPSTARKD